MSLKIRRPNDYNANAAAVIPQRPLPPILLHKLHITSTDVRPLPYAFVTYYANLGTRHITSSPTLRTPTVQTLTVHESFDGGL